MDQDLRDLERRAALGDPSAREAVRRARERAGQRRVAVIASIQGNLEALEAVLGDTDRQGITDVICLGGILDDGPDPLPCLRLVRERCHVVLAGKDERQLLDPESAARRWRRWYLDDLAEEDWAFVKSMRLVQRDDRRLYCYSDPRPGSDIYGVDPNAFETTPPSRALLDAIPGTLITAGVQHFPALWHHGRIGITRRPEHHAPHPVGRAIAWVGSVGKPRDRDLRASYLIVDDEGLEWRRVPYEVEKTAAKLRQHPAFGKPHANQLLAGQ